MLRICMDFDGVIHSFKTPYVHATIIPDPPVPGAIEAIEGYQEHFQVAIFSVRSSAPGGIDAMKRWLLKYAVQHFDHDNVAAARFVRKIEWPVHKPGAHLYIDDRGFHFAGSFPSIEFIKRFRPWNKL